MREKDCANLVAAVHNNKGIGNNVVGRRFWFWRQTRELTWEPTTTRNLEGKREGEERDPLEEWFLIGVHLNFYAKGCI